MQGFLGSKCDLLVYRFFFGNFPKLVLTICPALYIYMCKYTLYTYIQHIIYICTPSNDWLSVKTCYKHPAAEKRQNKNLLGSSWDVFRDIQSWFNLCLQKTSQNIYDC